MQYAIFSTSLNREKRTHLSQHYAKILRGRKLGGAAVVGVDNLMGVDNRTSAKATVHAGIRRRSCDDIAEKTTFSFSANGLVEEFA